MLKAKNKNVVDLIFNNKHAIKVYKGLELVWQKISELLHLVSVKGNSIQTSNPSPRNLFDGQWEYGNLNPTLVNTNPAYVHSKNRIEVKPQTYYYLKFYGTNFVRQYSQFYTLEYDVNDEYINGTRISRNSVSTNDSGQSMGTSANTKYVRFFYYNTSGTNSLDDSNYMFMMEEGNASTSYEPYVSRVPSPTNPIEIKSVGDKTINLFDKSRVIDGYRLNTASGIGKKYGTIGSTNDFITDNLYCVSHLIDVKEGLNYVKNTTADAFHRIHFYDSEQICINVTNSSYISAPSGAKYMSICMLITEKNGVQVEQGDASTSYEPFGYKLSVSGQAQNLELGLHDGEYVVSRKSDTDYGQIITASGWGRTDYIEVVGGKTYAYDYDNLTNASKAGWVAYDVSLNPVEGWSTNTINTQSTKQITMPSNAKWLVCSYMYTGTNATTRLSITPAEHTMYLQEPLRKIGEYEDELKRRSDGSYYVERLIYEDSDSATKPMSQGLHLLDTPLIEEASWDIEPTFTDNNVNFLTEVQPSDYTIA